MKGYIPRLVFAVVFACFSALPVLLAGFNDAAAQLDNAVRGRIITAPELDAGASVKGVRQRHVVWDTTHGVYLNYQPFARYTTLLAMLADSGFTMECCGTGLHTIDLSQYSVIVIAVGSSWYSAYTQEEIDSLLSYYGNNHQRVLLTGDMNFCENTYFSYADNVAFTYNVFEWLADRGGILIMGDNPGCNNNNINPVCSAFSMTAGTATLNPSDLYFSNFAAHPLFDGISQIYYRAAGQIAAATPAAPIAWTAANEPTIGLLDQMVDIEDRTGDRLAMPGITVEPNPFAHQARIRSPIAPGEGLLRIYDAGGRLVATPNGGVIGEDLRPGLYFLMAPGYRPAKLIKLR